MTIKKLVRRITGLTLFFVSALTVSGFAEAQQSKLLNNLGVSSQLSASLNADSGEILGAWNRLGGSALLRENGDGQRVESFDPIGDYETQLPHATTATLSRLERNLLEIYLNDSANTDVIKLLAVFNLSKSLVFSHRQTAAHLKRTVISLYFLNRLLDNGVEAQWVNKGIRKAERKLRKYIKPNRAVDLSEENIAHEFFIDSFVYNEQNRYSASTALLNAYIENPNNVYTSFLLMGSHTWISGEENYGDPVILNNMVTAAYFSLRAMDLAKRAEEAWAANPEDNSRFRMSNIIGGLSIISRQWLANVHNDMFAVGALDNEHREWRLKQKPFHSFSVGLSFFEDWATFGEGMAAWEEAFAVCDQYPTQRTCVARPRFSFNPAAMVTGYTDFLLKANLPQVAEMLLWHASSQEAFEDWDLGLDAWNHRMNNLDAIAAAYQNGDPSDDPLPLMMKKHKWGQNLPTCQVCHQSQSRVWTPEEQDEILLPLEEFATVGEWPVVSTTWYGAFK